MNEGKVKPGYYPEFPVDRILEPEFSLRSNVEEGIDDLVKEIRAAGMVIEPIICRPSSKPGYVELGPGERRLLAAKKMGMKTVPVIVKEMNDVEFDRVRMLENLARKNMSDIEIARVLKYMLEKYPEEYPSQEALSNAFGRSRRWVVYHLRMLDLEEVHLESENARSQWTEILSKITEFQAREILSAPPEKRVQVAERMAGRFEETGEVPSAREIREYVQGLIEPEERREAAVEAPEEAVVQSLDVIIPSKLEKPEDYVRAAEELMRRAEQMKDPKERFDERFKEAKRLIGQLKKADPFTRPFESKLDVAYGFFHRDPETGIEMLDDIIADLKAAMEKAEMEKKVMEAEEDLSKRLFKNPKMLRERARSAYYKELQEKYEVFRDRLLPFKAVRPVVDFYMNVGDNLSFYDVVKDLEEEVKRRHEDPSHVKYRRKLSSSDVRKILGRHVKTGKTSALVLRGDPDMEKAEEICPSYVVRFVWSFVPWKQHRLKVLRTLIGILAKEHSWNGKIYGLLAKAIEKAVPTMLVNNSTVVTHLRNKMAAKEEPEEFKYIRW